VDAVAANGAAGERNARLAQRAQHVIVERLQALLAHRAGVDFEQQARTALQVEAERNMALRPLRPARDGLFGEEVRHGEQAHDQRREHNSYRFPPREKQHRLTYSSLRPPRRLTLRSSSARSLRVVVLDRL